MTSQWPCASHHITAILILFKKFRIVSMWRIHAGFKLFARYKYEVFLQFVFMFTEQVFEIIAMDAVSTSDGIALNITYVVFSILDVPCIQCVQCCKIINVHLTVHAVVWSCAVGHFLFIWARWVDIIGARMCNVFWWHHGCRMFWKYKEYRWSVLGWHCCINIINYY